MNKLFTPYKLVYSLILLCCFTGFIQRYIPFFDKIVLVIFIIFSTLILLDRVFSPKRTARILGKDTGWVLGILGLYFVYALATNTVGQFAVQASIVVAFLIPLSLIHKLKSNEFKKLISLFVYIGLVQIFFDIFLPNPKYSSLDLYSGTFESGNNKARFLTLLLFIPVAVLLKLVTMKDLIGDRKRIFFYLPMVVILLSIYLGHSSMSILMFIAAVGIGFFIKRFWKFFLISLTGAFFMFMYIASILPSLTTVDDLWWFYYRFLEPKNGVFACYLYGWDLYKNTDYIGTGIGNFASRASILFETVNAKGYPAVIISDVGIDTSKYNGINAPDWGMSSMYLYFIEGGIFMLPLFFLFFKKMSKQSTSKVGSMMLFFLFYVLNYWPHFFEDYALFLYLSMYVIFNIYIKIVAENKIALN